MPDQSSDERLLNAYEKLYYFELDRKEKLFTRFPLLLAFYSILLGTLASYLSNLPEGALYLLVIFYATATGQVICVVWSAYHTYRFLYRDNYDYLLPDAPEEEPANLVESSDEPEDPGDSDVDVVR